MARPEKTESVLVCVGALAHAKQGARDLLAAAAADAPRIKPTLVDQMDIQAARAPAAIVFPR